MKTRVIAALVLVAAMAAGCSDSSVTSQENGWPLTGLPGYPGDHERQVITVKIDNTADGQPQVGVGQADLVIQELVEGGVTRLAAMFHSQQPTEVGPVRSLRETDVGLVLPTEGTLAASGGEESTVATVSGAGIPIVVEGAPGFSRDSSRHAPYNLMLDVAALSDTLPTGRPPGDYFTFGELAADAPGEVADQASLHWPAASTSFEFDPATGKWQRSDLMDSTGFDFTTVVALKLNVTYAGQDSSGTPIPTMHSEGSGEGVVLAGAKAYPVNWSKSSTTAPWSLTYDTTDGATEEFTLPAGRIWLALLPTDGSRVDLDASSEVAQSTPES